MALMAGETDRIVVDFGPALARIASAYERDPARREELTQEMLLAVVAALPRLVDPSKLRPFVFRIAHNRAVSHVIKSAREPKPAPGTGGALDAVPSGAPDQEQAFIALERSAALVEAIRGLALPYRQVVTLLLEGLSYDEIAEALGITASNVGIRINRAKQQLRERLDHVR
jgi:RNA polymerase sigma-70 factor (ECF subfamily)